LAEPLLSIAIPTRNRQAYALSAVRAILSTFDGDIEVVVHDNSDTPDLERMLGDMRADPRLRFTPLARIASPVENFDLAVQMARGTYVCAIGDDDVVNPELVGVCRWASQNGIDAIVTDRYRALFFWPDFSAADTGTTEAGSLQLYEFSGGVEDVDPGEELEKCARTGGTSLQRLPKVYLGVVRRQCLVDAFARVGNSQVGTCPDMYWGVAAASFTKRVVLFDYPLIVPGASAPSAAGAVRMRKHEGPLATAPHFRARPNYVWSPVIPAFYSVNTFYAESALLAMQATGRDDLVRRFNLPFLYATTAASHPEFRHAIIESMRHARESWWGIGKPRFAWRCITGIASAGAMLAGKRLASRSLRPGVTARERVVEGLSNSVDATSALIKHLQTRSARPATLLSASVKYA
jgi:glycosyltransferase involved in cell wall biosynthesis